VKEQHAPHVYSRFRAELGGWLERARSMAGLSTTQLAALTGISHDRLCRMALGSGDVVSVWEVYLICQQLGPCAPPVPFMPDTWTPAEVMKVARSLRPDEREDLVVACYSTVPGARVDVEYAREHDEWPLVVSDKMIERLHRHGLAWQLERFMEDVEDLDVNRAVCVRTYMGNAVAEILCREMF
jgi:hypothetical protein